MIWRHSEAIFKGGTLIFWDEISFLITIYSDKTTVFSKFMYDSSTYIEWYLDRCFVYHDLIGSMGSHRFIAPGFKPWPGHLRWVFHLSLYLITFGGHLAHLAYSVHKSSCIYIYISIITVYVQLLLNQFLPKRSTCVQGCARRFSNHASNTLYSKSVKEPL